MTAAFCFVDAPTHLAAAFCFLGATAHVAAAFCFVGATTLVPAAFAGTAQVVAGVGDSMARPLIGLGWLTKYTADGDAFACGLVVSGSLAIIRVAAGGGFVSIVHVAAGAGLRGRRLAEEGEVGHGLRRAWRKP